MQLYSHLWSCFENATEMKFSPRSCIGILNNTGLGSKENVVSHDTFPSSYIVVVIGGAFHHHLPLLIVVCYFFGSFFEISVWYCGTDPVKSQINYIHAIFFTWPIYHCVLKTFQVKLCQYLFLGYFFSSDPISSIEDA